MPLDLIITTKQKVKVTLAPKDSNGKPVVLTSKPTWAVSAGSATLDVADDGLSAFLISSDTEGDSKIDVSDTSPGSSAKDSITLHCDNATLPPAVAVDLGLTADAPVEK